MFHILIMSLFASSFWGYMVLEACQLPSAGHNSILISITEFDSRIFTQKKIQILFGRLSRIELETHLLTSFLRVSLELLLVEYRRRML